MQYFQHNGGCSFFPSQRPERAALDMTDSDTVMLTYRITEDADGRVLLLEELRVNADTAALAFRITPTTPKRCCV